jgi:hypothetical protein
MDVEGWRTLEGYATEQSLCVASELKTGLRAHDSDVASLCRRTARQTPGTKLRRPQPAGTKTSVGGLAFQGRSALMTHPK